MSIKLNNGQFLLREIDDFECDYCGEIYSNMDAFYINVDDEDKGICCPDCIATWFTEDPESITKMTIERVRLIKEAE